MTAEGREIDVTQGFDESGTEMAGMEGMGGMGEATQVAQFVRYSGWPELKEALISGRVKAAMMLAPMVMDLADQGVPVKIVSLGHRSGAVIMVKTDSPYRAFSDLRGKRMAIPSRFAVDYIFVRRLMRESGLKDGDLEFVEMAPPDMPAALLAGAVDAYATGEPFGAKGEMAGYARVLYMTRDVWPTYICCVLTVHEDLIRDNRPLVQTLVNYTMSAGAWLDEAAENRAAAAQLASNQTVFNQAVDLIRWVLERPKDRVTYGDLRLIRSEMDSMMVLAMEAKMFDHPIPYERYVDDSFIKNFTPVDIPLR